LGAIVPSKNRLNQDLQRIIDARHHDPFSILGRHSSDDGQAHVVVFRPLVEEMRFADGGPELTRIIGTDLFEWTGPASMVSIHYELEWMDNTGYTGRGFDPYCFGPQLSDFDMHLFNEGTHQHAYRLMGAHPHEVDGIEGTLFSVWAPAAERVSVIGNFNLWDGRTNPMRVRGGTGIWELFMPAIHAGEFYKFEIRNRDTGDVVVKTDPYGQYFEHRPKTAAVVTENSTYEWQDEAWIKRRSERPWQHEPMSIYEVHLGSWQQDEQGNFLSYRELAHRLSDYVKDLGFTHIELLPITEHPLDASWGYQTTGYFAPTSRFGDTDDFRYFVDYLHRHDIGVILDWAPGHFPKDLFALARFDGTALYEHEDPRKGEHQEWGTLIFNYDRNEVRCFLVSSAMCWMEEYHIDGLRVDAVASMLYLDYSREEGEWIPNEFGGNENLGAIEFMRQLNTTVQEHHQGVQVIAEESTSWPQVTRPPWLGGLGFTMKWNMGWMNDTLDYFTHDPVHRHYHHDQLTFGLLYSFSENFVLPFSHDEVVHGKRSLLYRMPGDEWQRFANLRLLLTYMWTYPGKKLLFMGCEFGQGNEWNFEQSLEWYLLQFEGHKGVQSLVRDLNRLYTNLPALHQYDFDWQGFEWVDCHDSAQSVLSYLRKSDEDLVLNIFNFTPVPREGYRIGVPEAGCYTEQLNSDSSYYGGSNMGNAHELWTEEVPWMGHPHSLQLTLPPLAGVVLKRDG
jgi:1,4-alpha-glucan branching enzyme